MNNEIHDLLTETLKLTLSVNRELTDAYDPDGDYADLLDAATNLYHRLSKVLMGPDKQGQKR